MRHITQEWSNEQLRLLKQDVIISRVEQVIIDLKPLPEVPDSPGNEDRKRYHEEVRTAVANDVEVYRRSARRDHALGTAALASSGVYALSLRRQSPGSSRATKAFLSGALLAAGTLIRRYGSNGIKLTDSVNDYMSKTSSLYE